MAVMRVSKLGAPLLLSTNLFDTETANVSEYQRAYSVTADVVQKCVLLSYFVSQRRFSKLEVNDWLTDLLKNEKNGLVQQHVAELLGLDDNLADKVRRSVPMGLGAPDIIRWWRTNRASYVTGSLERANVDNGNK